MGEAKRLEVKPIAASDARRIVKELHYSHKVVVNSQLHLGVFLDGRCGGAMQFGPSLDKRKMLGLVTGTLWNEFIELNRMAFADWLPRNGESRCIGFAMRWLRKHYPQIKWVVSFADGAQCGDGAISSGVVLTSIKKNTWGGRIVVADASVNELLRKQRRDVLSRTTLTKGKYTAETNGGSSMRAFKEAGFQPLPWFQLRYIYFIDQLVRQNLTVPILPFDEIGKRGAGMYRGKQIARAGSIGGDASGLQPEEGGSTPTPVLNSEAVEEQEPQ
jgi:hypothetical protein